MVPAPKNPLPACFASLIALQPYCSITNVASWARSAGLGFFSACASLFFLHMRSWLIPPPLKKRYSVSAPLRCKGLMAEDDFLQIPNNNSGGIDGFCRRKKVIYSFHGSLVVTLSRSTRTRNPQNAQAEIFCSGA